MSIDVINNLVSEIRVHGAVVVLGAGASFEHGMPLYNQLAPIVWSIIDEFPIIKNELYLDVGKPAKAFIGNDYNKLNDACKAIEHHVEANAKFKSLFCQVNNVHNTTVSPTHNIITKLIHDGTIKLVISLNWDDLLEVAWERRYGTKINSFKTVLIKPHGDVRSPQEMWTLPNSPGYVSENDLAYIQSIAHPSTLLIIGYSERDEFIVNQIIKPNEDRWHVFRISPSAPKTQIALHAKEAMERIYKAAGFAENSWWDHVNYSSQRDFGPAIMGYRLTPSDVRACPRLPQLEDAKKKLDVAHYVFIKGAPGCGKSITAYQMAYDYLIEGWEVVRIKHKNVIENEIELFNNGYPTIYIVDDAQQIDNYTIQQLSEQACSSSKLILCSTIVENKADNIILIDDISVAAIMEHYQKHKEEVLDIIRSNNGYRQTIGDNYWDFSYERALEAASKEKTPWLFNYALRGGWESTKTDYQYVCNHDQADIIWMLIAFRQTISLDKSVPLSWLKETLSLWGYDENWCISQLDFLFAQRFIISTEEIRVLHLEQATRILARYISETKEKSAEVFYDMVRNELLSNSTPLLGICWLFNHLFAYDISHRFRYFVLTDEFTESLLFRCMAQTSSEDRSHAAFVIDDVLLRKEHFGLQDILLKHEGTLIKWFTSTDNETAYSYSRILNSMINAGRDIHDDFIKKLDLDSIISNVENMSSQFLFHWASFLNRLNLWKDKKRNRSFFNKFNRDKLRNIIRTCTIDDIHGLYEFIETIMGYDLKFGFELYEVSLPLLQTALTRRFYETLEDLGIHFRLYILGHGIVQSNRPTKKQEAAGKQFVALISSGMIKSAIETSLPRHWRTLFEFSMEVARRDKQKMEDAVKCVDFSILDEKTKNMWTNQSEDLSKRQTAGCRINAKLEFIETIPGNSNSSRLGSFRISQFGAF